MLLLILPSISAAQKIDFTELPLEELLRVEVFSVSRKIEQLFQASAAISVITAEEMRRSGYSSISAGLQLAPGMNVARIDANKWAISCRGFNNRFANKLLLLIDGHSAYTPTFAGVFWETQDILIEDVEQIEVIRGPGATLWGANAVNGIINIISKSARRTQGKLLTLGVGTERRFFTHFRFGSSIGNHFFYRFYLKAVTHDNFVGSEGETMADGWNVSRGGFRADWKCTPNDSVFLQGNYYNGKVGYNYTMVTSFEAPYQQTFTFNAEIKGGNLTGRWHHFFSPRSATILQVSFDNTTRNDAPLQGKISTFNFDWQHQFGFRNRHEIVWGLRYRQVRDKIKGTLAVSFIPPEHTCHLASAFVQDKVALMKERLHLIIGSKFENNSHSGFEYQPNVRLLWRRKERHTLWAAVSRAVRTPARADEDMVTIFEVVEPERLVPPIFFTSQGNPDFASEILIAHEIGNRTYLTNQLFFDIAAFFNTYNRLRTIESGEIIPRVTPASVYIIAPATFNNKMFGKTYGIEFDTKWQPKKWLQMRLIYTVLQMDLQLRPDSKDSYSVGTNEVSPQNQFCGWWLIQLSPKIDFDLGFRYVGPLTSMEVPAYCNLDVHLGWRLLPNIEFSLVGHNLLQAHHQEFGNPTGINMPLKKGLTAFTEVERGVFGAITWNF